MATGRLITYRMEVEVRQASVENITDDMPRALVRLETSVDVVDPTTLELKIANWNQMRALLTAYIGQNMKEGIDYYTLISGGKESKPSLSKAGSEKFLSLFNLQARFRKDDETWEMLGRPAGVICYVCALYTKSGEFVGEGRGAREVRKDRDINKAIKMAQKCLGGRTPVLIRSAAGAIRTDIHRMSQYDLEDLYIAGPGATWRKVLDIRKQPPATVRRLTFQDGLTVSATREHRWPLATGELAYTAALKVGDVLQRSTLPPGVGNADLDYAWMAGLFIAEGTTRERYDISFHLHADEQAIVDRLRRIAERLGASVLDDIRGNHREFTIWGPAGYGIVRQFVDGKHSYGKHFSRWIFRQRAEVIQEALLGYLAGDGSYTVRTGRQPFWTLGFTRKNRELADDLRAICAILHLRGKIAPGTATETKSGKTFEIYTGWIKMVAPHYNDLDLTEIIAIEEDYQMTYEIEVDGDHLFCLANGLVTHNSAQIDAILRTGSLSDSFTQDLEDQPEQEERMVKQQKKHIVALLKRLGTDAVDKAGYEAAVQHYTGLALVPESYQEIIHRLEAWITESLPHGEPCDDEING